ncbi:MAG TPA: hypothetical protein DEQ61_19605 [Streptomyces sp.]|nr:hypothetical protein [Streptomyces sp.]
MVELNLLLSGQEEKPEVIWGDALEVDLGQPFDTVSVNAPMMPSFGLHLPWRADGGPDGNRILEAALRRVRLTPEGQLLARAWMVGSAARGRQVAWLQRLAREREWAATVTPTGSTKLERGSVDAHTLSESIVLYGAAQYADAVYEQLTDIRESTGVDRSFPCLLHALPSGKPEVTVLRTPEDGPHWRL